MCARASGYKRKKEIENRMRGSVQKDMPHGCRLDVDPNDMGEREGPGGRKLTKFPLRQANRVPHLNRSLPLITPPRPLLPKYFPTTQYSCALLQSSHIPSISEEASLRSSSTCFVGLLSLLSHSALFGLLPCDFHWE